MADDDQCSPPIFELNPLSSSSDEEDRNADADSGIDCQNIGSSSRASLNMISIEDSEGWWRAFEDVDEASWRWVLGASIKCFCEKIN